MNTNAHEHPCSQFDAYWDDALDSGERQAFEVHLADCPDCQKKQQTAQSLKKNLQAALNQTLPETADLRIRKALRDELTPKSIPDDILDIEDAARLLKISVSEIASLLDQLPCLNISGKIRFRRDRLLQWAVDQEEERSRTQDMDSRQEYKKTIPFPGGIR